MALSQSPNKSGNGNGITPPPTPQQQNGSYSVNGQQVSSSTYNPSTGTYQDSSYLSPDQTSTQNNSNSFMNSIISGAQNSFNMSPQALQQGVDAYTEPMYAANQRGFNQESGNAINQAASAGGQNSVGFNKYYADNIARVNASNQADIAAQGEQMKYQLPSMALQPYQDAFNLANGGSNSVYDQTQGNLAPSVASSQAGNSFALQNYQNQLNAYNSSFMGRANAAYGGVLGGSGNMTSGLGGYGTFINPLGF